ncbi:MAG TPA: DUF692 domain-containing protein [Methylomirabilota bacterium]|jgi:hypothetical protein|nr:DUF692 domain-containing protein [Methylomirabilota bacterium]
MNGKRDLPSRAGIGLKAPHVGELLATRPAAPWLEVHPENYMSGGIALASLEAVRREYPVSLHGVGLSLGTAGDIDARHLSRLRSLVERIEPCLVSEHLSWSTAGGVYLNHLLPLPYTDETLGVVADHVDEVQNALGRRILIENPSSYLRFRHSSMAEPHFLAELARRTGCGLLCDVNNIYVSAWNVDFDAGSYLDTLPVQAIGEIHLAGHAANDADGRTILIDDHGSPVTAPVWKLYQRALERFGSVPTLIEWDTDLPELSVLLGEASVADRMLQAFASEDDHACAA